MSSFGHALALNDSNVIAAGGTLFGLLVSAFFHVGCSSLPSKSGQQRPAREVTLPKIEPDMSANTNCDFSKLPEHAAAQDPCSPPIGEFDFAWRGVKINMPGRVAISGDNDTVLHATGMRVPVYILLQATLRQTAKHETVNDGTILTFVDISSGETFASTLMTGDSRAPSKRRPIPEDQLDTSVTRHYANINALEFVKLPNRPATYDVHAKFGDFKSDVMTIRVE